MNIKGQSFLKLLDFTPEQIAEFLALAAELKAKKKGRYPPPAVRGQAGCADFREDQHADALLVRGRGT